MLIGYMHYRKSPAGLNRAYAFAAVAKAEGAELLYFSPGAADFRGKVINGYIYGGGEWTRTVSRYPDVIYNTAAFSKDKQIEAAERLRRSIPFTSYSVGDKLTVYNNLMKYKTFADYLVPSEEVLSAKQFFAFSEKYPETVFKPSRGRQGTDVYFIKREGRSFRIMSGAGETACGAGETRGFIRDKIEREGYIVQPYINCRTKAGVPYDFRLHVQKGRGGEWVTSGMYPRISPDGGIVCNISRGGYTNGITDFLKREFGADYYETRKYIEIFSLQLAAHMDTIQRGLYGEELDELGIDIGLDGDRRIYIYEINWRPGHPPFVNVDLSVIKNTVMYAMHLAGRAKENGVG